MVQIYKDEAVIFDLDDLLYKEFDFMRSGFWAIARTCSEQEPKKLFRLMMAQYFSGNAVLNWLSNDYLAPKSEHTLRSLLTIYRTHKPDISLSADAVEMLSLLKQNGNRMGLITDGRSITQRNKIEALNLSGWISDFTISEELGFEKPSQKPFLYYMDKFDCRNFVYLADNYNKDFVAPNQLGWRTIALTDNGLNIHAAKQGLDPWYYPAEIISSFSELKINATCLIGRADKK
jgi:putative hydrolase of the HAD superfamily